MIRRAMNSVADSIFDCENIASMEEKLKKPDGSCEASGQCLSWERKTNIKVKEAAGGGRYL